MTVFKVGHWRQIYETGKLSPVTLKCLLSRENLNSALSALYIEVTTTFDLLNQFQENIVFERAQAMHNFLRSIQSGSFAAMENRDLLN